MQHDPPTQSRGAVPESAAGDPRGGPRPHRTHDREPGPEIRHDREFRRADAVPHRRPPPATPLPDVPHGEARARRHLGGCEGEHRGGWPHGARGGSAILARCATAPPRGAEPQISGRIGVTEPRHLLGDRVVTVALENVGDLWEEAAAGVGPFLKPNRRIPREFAKTVGNLKGKLEEVIELTMTAFFANDLGKANTALDHQAPLIRDSRAAAESGPRSRSPPARGTPRSNGLFQLVLRPLE